MLFMVGFVQDNFLLVSSDKALYQLSLDTESEIKILEDVEFIRSMTFDPVEKKIYWTTKKDIKRTNLNGTGIETIHAGT